MIQPKKQSLLKRIATGATLVATGIANTLSGAVGSNVDNQIAKKPIQPIVQKAPIDITSKTDYFGKYVYRGFNFSDEPVVQENLTISHKGLTAWLFGNYNTETKQIDEQDLILDFTTPINKKGNLLLSMGHGTYTFPGTDIKKTQEVYAGLILDNPKLFNPTLFLFHDFKDGNGNYVELGGSTQVKGVDLSGKIGYNNHYYRKDSGFSHLEFRAARPIKLNNKTTLIPSVTLQKALQGDFTNKQYLGISIEHKF